MKSNTTMSRKSVSLVGLVLPCCHASLTEQRLQGIFKDPKEPIDERVKDLLGKMNLEEKVGQMTQIERKNASAEVLKSYFIGSVLSGGGSTPKVNATVKEWVDMVNGMQQASLSTRLGIPMIYGIDAVHGHNNVMNATIFPHNVGLDHRIVQQLTEIIDGFQGEAKTDMKGMPYVNRKTKVAGSSKHYVGDGGTVKGINENNTIVDDSALYGMHMAAYVNSVAKGIATIMASYSSINGVKMHAHKQLLTDYLKGKLGFKGFIISDWEGIDRITSPAHSNYNYSIQASINAGIDMVMVPYNYTEFYDGLIDLVKKNAIPMSRIDDAVSRILRVKFAMGLFENPLGDYSLINEVGSQKHRELARQAVRKSIVLLKNGKPGNPPILPLPKNAGSHANNLGYQCGGWTIEWQGVSGNNWTAGTTILDGIKATVDKRTKVVYKKKPSDTYSSKGKMDYGIVVVGEVPYAETNGDSQNLTIPAPGLAVIENVCKETKCVVIIVSGRPVVIEPYVDKIDALVAAWLPGSEGQGVADVLFGDYGFTGKLARTWFKRVDQLPMNYGDPKYDPLFPFGFGLETKPIPSTKKPEGKKPKDNYRDDANTHQINNCPKATHTVPLISSQRSTKSPRKI
ncbi:beta-glucosidase BoGH3B-like [Gossypium australe]|uniref:Beta-glucosidase BoGH3B-like n=1 Tax=Gossypium australe TaxID=47621 RepID=A0A5B6V807_9ROSI|nr:beta-glucosidase BoGH3B-like [Gossypium australe]